MKVVYNLIMVFSLLTFLSACGNETQMEENFTPTGRQSRPDKIAVKVDVSKARILSDQSSLTVSGQIEADVQSKISARMMGYVTDVHARVGNFVKKGQKLISIKNSEVQAKHAQVEASIVEAKAALKNIEINYNRMKTLLEKKSITLKEFDDISMQYDMAKARVSAAESMRSEVEEMMGYATITAPISGVVTEKMINKGEMANPGMPLLNIEAPGTMRVSAMIPENYINYIEIRDEVDVVMKSSGKAMKGHITEIVPSSKMTGSQFEIKIRIDGKDKNEKLYSGMYANVHIKLPDDANLNTSALMIPVESIVEYGQLNGVFAIAHDTTAVLRWLRLGETIGDQVEVLSGLKDGELFVLSAESKLENGTPIILK
jgi:RND family efflux transporter MFP subunit